MKKKHYYKSAIVLMLCFVLLFSSCAAIPERQDAASEPTALSSRPDVNPQASQAVSEPVPNPVSEESSAEETAEEIEDDIETGGEADSGKEEAADIIFAEVSVKSEEPPAQKSFNLNVNINPDVSNIKTEVLPGDEIIDLKISTAFNVTKPAAKITTEHEGYFITGTSNPDFPVLFDGEEVTSRGAKGTFGVFARLDMGENNFTLSQNGENIRVTIVRIAKQTSAKIIDVIENSSMYPLEQGGANAGEEFIASCIAPAGAEVTAVFGGVSAKLEQKDTEAKAGTATLFSGAVKLTGDYPKGVTTKIGTVTYILEYNGKKTNYESGGSMYIAGEGGRAAIELTGYAGFVYNNNKSNFDFKEKVKAGARDYIVSMDNSYAEIASGGFVPLRSVKVIEGETEVETGFTGSGESFENSFEAYSFEANRLPVYVTELSEDEFSITFYNTAGMPDFSTASSKLFSAVAAEKSENSVTYTFAIKNKEKLWGYNISFADGEIELKFKYRPVLSSNADKPLAGIRIMLDPGHGGRDPGALGVPGTTGPAESAINLAHAYAIRNRLMDMGATVIFTRQTDLYLSLDERMECIEDDDADIFLSVHHNSIGENIDSSKVSGMEMYYHTVFSEELAKAVMLSLETNTGRKNRRVSREDYRVTLMPYAPSILMELGFMSNPEEYEKTADPAQIELVAASVANGVLMMLSK